MDAPAKRSLAEESLADGSRGLVVVVDADEAPPLVDRTPELAWANSPFRELFRLAWPMAISTVSYSLMTLTDTLFVGRLGAAALAGVGVGGVAAFALLSFGLGWIRALKVLVSHAVGAGQRAPIRAYLTAALGCAAVMGIVLGLAGYGVAQLLPWITDTRAAGDAARSYLEIRVVAAPLVLLAAALREYRHGIGDTRTAMWAMLAANVVNIGLDALFVLGFGWGVDGVAWATVIGHVVWFGWLVGAELRDGVSLGGARLVHVRSLWRVGVPTGVQFLLEVGSFSVLTATLAILGDMEVAAHQIAIQVMHFSFLPVMALAEAASMLAGQAVGARRDDLVPSVARKALLVASGYALVWTVVLGVFAPTIALGFTDDPSLIETTIPLLWVAAVFQWFDGAQIVGANVLRGTGDVRYAAVVGIAATWLMTPPLTWLLGYGAGLGALGGWLGLCAEIMCVAALFWWRLRRGGWKAAAAKERALAVA
jgi:MATE family multidrug resistance protein